MRGSRSGSFILLVSLGIPAAASGRELTFEQRVRAEEAIERVYYAHQIGNTRPFEDAVPRAVLEQRVTTYLKQTVALQSLWKTPVTDAMLERELLRMTANSRMPERLRELYGALGNDSFVIHECLVRATLVDRLAHSLFGFDESLHAREREEAEELRRGLLGFGVERFLADPRSTVVEISRLGAENGAGSPAGGGDARTISLSPDEFARWRGRAPVGVGQIGPVRSERDAFVTSVVLEERAAWARVAYFSVPKRPWSDWWNGAAANFDARQVRAVADASVARTLALAEPASRSISAKPSTFPVTGDDSWDDGSLDDLPHPRSNHTKAWTGSLMVVWGGYDSADLNTGGRYDPATDSWTAMATRNAPPACEHPTATWTGDVVVIRCGVEARSPDGGGRYDPATDTWSTLGLAPEAPEVRTADPQPTAAPVGVARPDPLSTTEAAPGGFEVDGRLRPGPVAPPTVAPPNQATGNQGPNMPPITATPNGFSFPTTSPVISDMFLGAQGGNFGYCQAGPNAGLVCSEDTDCLESICENTFDNMFCLSYNMSCSGEKTNEREYGFNDVLEATYDHSPAPGRQTWIERNWNYRSVDGTTWRPFSFVLDVDANSSCVGGTNHGAPCTLLDVAGVCKGGGTCTGKVPTGGAWWTFIPNNRQGNSSLILRWPWATVNVRDGTDAWWTNGFSSWMRTSDFDPGGTASGARFTTYADHTNDRMGPWLNGLYSIVDFNTTSAEGKVGWVNAGFFDARISGTTPAREIRALTGVRSEVNLASTGSPQVVGQSFGVYVQFNPSGSNLVDTSHTGVYINTPTAPGSGTTIPTQHGLWIADQELVRSGGGGSAILVSAQTTSNGSEGNIRLAGGNWNNGHIQFATGHLWRDTASKVLRYVSDKVPESETDGRAVVTGTGSNSHGVVFWGVSTAIDPNFDTGNEVCAASGTGLTCVETSEFQKATTIGCSVAHAAAKWIAFCK